MPALNKYQELEVERQGQNSMKDSLKYQRARSFGEDDRVLALPESPSACGGFGSQSQHSYSHALLVPRSPSWGKKK